MITPPSLLPPATELRSSQGRYPLGGIQPRHGSSFTAEEALKAHLKSPLVLLHACTGGWPRGVFVFTSDPAVLKKISFVRDVELGQTKTPNLYSRFFPSQTRYILL